MRELAEELPENTTRYKRLLETVSRAADEFDHANTDDVSLKRSAERVLARLDEAKTGADDSALSMHLIGHSHMDVVWLWELRETIRK